MTESPLSAIRVASLVALLSMTSMFAALHAAPPTQNLSVEVRIADDSVQASQGARAGAVVTRSSSGQASAQGTVVVQSGTRRQGMGLQQQVLVLNGGHANLQIAQGMPVDDTEVAWTPWGPAAAVRSQWVELVNGIEVWPRWPGGDAPVSLDISVQRAAPLANGTVAQGVAKMSLVSSLQLPLGEWVSVAQVQQRRAGTAQAANGFSAATTSRGQSLQVRVSLP
jgi:hypothetical protein